MPFYTAEDGCRIFYETLGNGEPEVALIPGLGGDGRFWREVVVELSQDHRLIVIDHRGAGRSDRPNNPYSLDQISRDIAGVLATVAEGPLHVVGHSTGGAIAQILALDHPEVGCSFTVSSSWARADARFRALFEARAAVIEAGLAQAYQNLTHVLGFDAAYLETCHEALDAALATAPERLAPYEVTAARVRMLLEHDRADELHRISAPVLVIAADADEITPPAMAEAIAASVPGACLVRVPGPHFHPVTDPLGFAGLVREFVRRLSYDPITH